MDCGSDGGDQSPQHHQPSTHSYKPSKFLTSWSFTDKATLASLLERESDSKRKACWQKHQLELTEGMRCRVVDWMMDVTSDFCMKRDTFHGAVWILDSMLSSSFPISKRTFQLVALVSILLSAKLEEISTPSIADYTEAVEYGYSAGEIRRMEREVLKALRWKLTPSTLSVWVNWTMTQWDGFALESLGEKCMEMPLFKAPQKDSYTYFRYCFQLTDSLLFKSSHYLYSKPQLCSALLYLSLAHSLCSLPDSLSPTSVCNWHKKDRGGRELMAALERFVNAVFGVDIEKLGEVVEYVWEEGRVRNSMEMPKACRVFTQSVLEQHFEDFLCYQTYTHLCPSSTPAYV